MSATARDYEDRGSFVSGVPMWLLAITPLILLGLVVWGIVALEPTRLVRGAEFPPIEELSIVRTVLSPGMIELHLVNGGPDDVTVAQVQVDEAYWTFQMEPQRTLRHLERATVQVPYPWVSGEAHEVTLVSRNGVKFSAPIEVAVESPRPSWSFFAFFALLGVLVGVVPVYLGLIWYPMLRRLGDVGINVLLCATIGLLIFLVVEAVHEGIEMVGELPGVYGGAAMLVLGIGGTVLLLTSVGEYLRQRARSRGEQYLKLSLAYMIAVGIGLHNMGEGLAIGAAYNAGAVSLGTLLLIGFTIHNVTEGLAIVSPLARVRAGLGTLLMLGFVAGFPTIIGAWVGGFTYSAFWSLVFMAIGAGAILQVVFEITRQMAGDQAVRRVLTRLPNLAGLAAGFMVMYTTKLLVAM